MWWLPISLAAELSGTLAGADGEPVVGATVLVYDSRFNYGQATTRSGGEWGVRGLPPDRYRIRFKPANDDPHGDRFYGGAWDACEAESVGLDAEESVLAGLDDTLEVGAAVAGRVTDLDGVALAGVRVAVYGAEARTSLVLREAVTDEAGAFSVQGLDADAEGSTFLVYFEVDGWPGQWLGPAYADDSGEAVTLSPDAPMDLGDAALLDGIRVSGLVTGPEGPVSAGTVVAYSTGQVTTESLAEGGRYVAEGLPPGEVVVWASSPGLATTYYPNADRPSGSLSVPAEGGEGTVDLDLPAEGTLTLEADVGAAAEGVGVVVYNDTYTVGRGASFGPSGVLTVGGLHAGSYEVYVSGGDLGFVSGFLLDAAGERESFAVEAGSAARVGLTLRPASTLSGIVKDDEGAPVYGATLVATETLGEERSWSTTTARDGTWELVGVDATTITLSGQFRWYCPDDLGYAHTWYEAARREEEAAYLLVPEGAPLGDLELVLPRDLDHDGMGDAWEEAHGLDPDADDSAEDADGDGYSNLEEWQLDTDPSAPFVGGDCGGECAGATWGIFAAPAGLLRRRKKLA